MTFYTTYQIVDSPLNQDFEPLLRIRKRDIIFVDPVTQRMFFILGFVIFVVLAFTTYIAPNISDKRESTANQTENSTNLASQEDNVVSSFVIDGVLSPIFSPEVQYWRPKILAWSAKHQLDPDIVATIMQIESCGDPGALSSAGAQGLFQVMPFHFQPGENMMDPETNAHRGLSYYVQQLKETGGDIFLSFAGYNGGSAASSSSWSYWANETQRYYVWSKGIYEEAKAGLTTSPTLQRWMEAGGASLCHQAANSLNLN